MASEELFGQDFSEEVNADLEDLIEEVENNNEDEEFEMPENEDDVENTNLQDTNPTTTTDANSDATKSSEPELKLIQLPLTRIRNIMKLDPDLHIASNESVFMVTRATELFIESLARESFTYTAQAKKKTIQKRDVDMAISAVDSLMFLEGAMNF